VRAPETGEKRQVEGAPADERPVIARLLLGLAAVAAVVLLALPNTTAADVAAVVGAGAAATAAWVAVRRHSRGRSAWALLAAGTTATGLGNLVSLYLERAAGVAPAVSPADVLWLSSYPLTAAALVVMVRRRAPGQLRSGFLDASVLTVAAAVTAWQFLIVPNLSAGGLSVANVLAAAYPLGDVFLLAGALVLVLSPGTRGTATRMLVASCAIAVAADTGYGVLPSFLDDAGVSRLDGVLQLSTVLLVAVMLRPDAGELVRPVPMQPGTLHPARVLFLGMGLLTAPTLAILSVETAGTKAWLLLAATTAECAFILARFTAAVREQERAQRQLQFQASHDVLTGLANRATLAETLRTSMPDAPVVLYIDLDGFKAVNDTSGHAAGDAVLIAVAERLRAVVRSTDTVARLGGDEFAVVCPGLTVPAATALAERILAALAEPVPGPTGAYRVGASVGIAPAAPGAAPEEVMLRADAAMYEAKRSGRSRWILAA
jgi:diguanylate cyclase (GGDEF)-like protein